jgi:cellulose synthase/poly-beta-1,6-N-acetylglucosamine synthase-like glycosyltransferase
VVFAIEMLGAMSIIFYGIWLVALPDNEDIKAQETVSKFRRQYHIRVLIPCYSEPLAIVQRTILAARRAIVPPGCELTIYLCDDGKKSNKQKFCDSLADTAGPRVIYVTGRPKNGGKTLNGKSENLNHTLKMIYPADRGEDEVPNIPLAEVMCLFDADQSCSKTFFTSLMPYIDSGDDVAVALSPQLMFNVDPNADIFNHQNVHFWEKMQPGMDALGFISLTGTNMILRCRALQDCGWFPVDSVTEDWELGMRMARSLSKAHACKRFLCMQSRSHISALHCRSRRWFWPTCYLARILVQAP